MAGHPARLASLALASLVFASAPAAADPWHQVAVPGGVATLADAAGLDPTLEPWRLLPSVLRRLHPLAAASTLLPAATFLGPLDGQSLSVPLPAEAWDRAVFLRTPQASERLGLILRDRRAALLCRGLLALDDPTLDFLATRPSLLRALYERHAPAFAAFSAGIRIRHGALGLPGGAGARPLWESAAGHGTTTPEAFLEALFTVADGRLAWLFDTVARADEPHRLFALGAALPVAERAPRFAALRAAFSRARPFWRERHVSRRLPDPAWVLLSAEVTPAGALAGGRLAAFWDAALEGRRVRSGAAGAAADAAWLVETIGLMQPWAGRERLLRLAFAQRLLAARPALRDDEVVEALRAFAHAPALTLSLERLGLSDPAALSLAGDRADRIGACHDPERAALAIAQLEGGLALVERARWARTLNQDAAVRLAKTLLEVPLRDDARYDGGVLEWLERAALPALAAAAGGSPDAPEDLVARAVSGMRAVPPGPPVEIVFEGLGYRVDPAAGLKRRFDAGRARQGGPSLDAVLAFSRAVLALRARADDAAARARLQVAAAALEPFTLQGARRRYEPRAASRAGDATIVAEALLARALIGVAYAAQAGNPEFAALAARHDLGLALQGSGARNRLPWRLPGLTTRQGWTVLGSLIPLECGLSLPALARIDGDLPLHAPALDPAEAGPLALSVALMSPFAIDDAEGDAVVAALRRGRERLLALRDAPEAASRIGEELMLPTWRLRALRGLLASGEASSALSLAELLRLGGGGEPSSCDAWGASALADGGEPCLRLPALRPWEDLDSVDDAGLLASRLPDVSLRALEGLAALSLPAQLAPALSARLMQDLVDAAQPADRGDGFALARFVASIPQGRIEDAVASLAHAGPLVPAKDAAAR